MTQNLVSLTLTDAQLEAVDQALAALENQLVELVALTPAQRRAMPKMGENSEAFCRQTISLMSQNPQIVPASVSVPDAVSDLSALDRLRPRAQRLTRLAERVVDTQTALGSDVMATSLQGYALLKVAGQGQGLASLREGLGARFAKRPRAPVDKAA
jgi:hypothetical protein